MKARAQFIVEESQYDLTDPPPRVPFRLVLRDVGHDGPHPTITNDAEAVVAQLVAEGLVRAGTTLLYYDSQGELTRLVHDGTVFRGFAPAAPGEP